MIEKIFIRQGLKKLELDDYLAKELDRAGFTKSEIMKTPLVTRIVVNVTRPGLAIGKSGSNIAQLTRTIEERFGIDNPQLEIKEIENAALDSQAVANKIKALIEKGFSWRSVIFKIVTEIKATGAPGLEILLSGKLAGKGGRKRKQRIAYGYMKKVGEQAKLVDRGAASAYPKVGAIGIKVSIVHPDTVFPDKVDIKEAIKKVEKLREEVEAKENPVETPKETSAETKEEVKETTEKTEAKEKASPKKETKEKEAVKKTEKKEKPKEEKAKKEVAPEAKEKKAEVKEEKPREKKAEVKKEPEAKEAEKKEVKDEEKKDNAKDSPIESKRKLDAEPPIVPQEQNPHGASGE